MTALERGCHCSLSLEDPAGQGVLSPCTAFCRLSGLWCPLRLPSLAMLRGEPSWPPLGFLGRVLLGACFFWTKTLSDPSSPPPKFPLSVQSIFFYSIKQTKARAALSPESAALGFTRLGFANHLHAGTSGDPPTYSTSQMGERGLEGEGHSAKSSLWRLDLGPSDSALGEPSPARWPISTSL